MKQTILILVVAVGLCSCKALIGTIYGFNNKMKFKTSDEYISYVEKKKDIPKSSILIPDSASYDAFLKKVIGEQMGVLYGSFLDDSTILKRSDELQENVTCMGRILSDVRNNVAVISSANDSLIERYDFNQFTFNNAETGSVYKMESSSKPIKLFLLYYYSGGSYFNRLYRDVFAFANQRKDEVDVKVIVTDRIALKQ